MDRDLIVDLYLFFLIVIFIFQLKYISFLHKRIEFTLKMNLALMRFTFGVTDAILIDCSRATQNRIEESTNEFSKSAKMDF